MSSFNKIMLKQILIWVNSRFIAIKKVFMGQLTKGDLIEKLSSEEFLKMIVEEFNKLIRKK